MVISYITPQDSNLSELRLVLAVCDVLTLELTTKQEYYYSYLLVIALLVAIQYLSFMVLFPQIKLALNKSFI